MPTPPAVGNDPRIVVGCAAFGDAAVGVVAEGLALGRSVDCVALAGEAAYAPRTALAIAGAPVQPLSREVLATIPRGARGGRSRRRVGLLVALPTHRARDYLGRVPGACEIGEIEPRGAHAVVVD